MFETSIYKGDLFRLAPHFAAQEYPTSCGPATLRLITAAIYKQLNKQFPIIPEQTLLAKKNGIYGPKFYMSEKNAMCYTIPDTLEYDIIARQKKYQKKSYSGGIEPSDMAKNFECHDSRIHAQHIPVKTNEQQDIQNLREIIKATLNNSNKYIVVNYHLGIERNITSGHFSPIVAYHAKEDKVLLMNVASHIGGGTGLI